MGAALPMAATKPRRVRKTNGQQFRALLEQHGITTARAAEILRRPERTIERWITDPDTSNYRKMHDDTLEIFRIRLKDELEARANAN